VTFRSLALPRFWDLYDRLPLEVQTQADKQYALFAKNPRHASLRFKQVGPFWSVRLSYSYRALAVRDENTLTWFWIGTHADYDKLLA
jgi:hypothetical protein